MFHPNLTERLRHSQYGGIKWAHPLALGDAGAVTQLPIRVPQPISSATVAKSAGIRRSGVPEQAVLVADAFPTARFWRIIREWTGLAVMAGVGLAVIGGALFVAALSPEPLT